ncbi:MAG: FkbM family methyltransferase [Candidatus Omnitrophica bacterium]|nr:FkbM family methyltransferase [Candidatus Omnitrophota bacterium]
MPENLRRKIYHQRFSTTYDVEALEGVRFSLDAHSGSDLWKERLSEKEGHEVGLCRWFQRNIQKEDVVFEVGSCFAFFPSLISTLSPEVEIHTFEPNWKLNAFVEANSKKNKGARGWTVNEAFVCDKSEGQTKLNIDDYSRSHSTVPSIVKIDVDGPEQLVLQGCKQLIEKRQTQFLVEVHPKELPRFQGSIEGLLNQFPKDYQILVMTEIRDRGEEWSEDLKLLESDSNPYLSAAPEEIFRR